jgi:hypothetical protein
MFNYKSNNDFDYLKVFNVNFDNMERLSIVRVQYALRNSYDHLLRNFFLLKNLEKSLIYLKLDLNNCRINANMFENINNFNSLNQLYLKGFEFVVKSFILKLKNLIYLYINNCININLLEIWPKLKSLNLVNCIVPNLNQLIKFPELEICNLNSIYNTQSLFL